LTYGKNGLLSFLERLFRGLGTSQRRQFTYYFSLKENLNHLEKDIEIDEAVNDYPPFLQ
jgi:hypothetical protein